mmetsp:Transcript_4651/g.18566  ORF Transcript_4651/g.18566 Transcript_4651/m.18566 type:complete len:272 (-) Transcript_4651:561-1376(-)
MSSTSWPRFNRRPLPPWDIRSLCCSRRLGPRDVSSSSSRRCSSASFAGLLLAFSVSCSFSARSPAAVTRPPARVWTWKARLVGKPKMLGLPSSSGATSIHSSRPPGGTFLAGSLRDAMAMAASLGLRSCPSRRGPTSSPLSSPSSLGPSGCASAAVSSADGSIGPIGPLRRWDASSSSFAPASSASSSSSPSSSAESASPESAASMSARSKPSFFMRSFSKTLWHTQALACSAGMVNPSPPLARPMLSSSSSMACCSAASGSSDRSTASPW